MNDFSLDRDPSGEILVVDDTPANLRLLANLLTRQGYQVRTIPSGKLALDSVQLSLPDLILLDINMPEMDGYEVCQILKADAKTADVPIIFISALSEVWDKVKAFTVGGVDYITKPFQTEEVLARITIHLQFNRLYKYLQTTNLQQAQQLVEQNQQLLDMNRTLERSNQALKEQYQRLQETQLQLVQAEKMATLGQLVAGIGHEISNPLTAISSNLTYLDEYTQKLIQHLQLYQTQYSQANSTIQQHEAEIELDFLQEDLPQLLQSIQTGSEQLYHISHSLRIFTRSDMDQPIPFDLHEGLESTLLLLKHRLKANEHRPEIEVIKQYDNLSPVACYAGRINQVFMNILANAIDALEETNQNKTFDQIEADPNQIRIQTRQQGDSVLICIADNGKGIPLDIQTQVFDYLFTTKPIGKGTGMGLAIARQIIEEKHRGKLSCYSESGKGTEFVIELPRLLA